MIKKVLITLFLLLLLPAHAYAQATFTLPQPSGYGIPVRFSSVPYAEGQVETVIVNVINLLFTIGGIGVVVYFVWGAVDWILSGGDKEKVSNARKKMTHAIIGLVLLSLSYVIINLVGTIVGFNPLRDLQLRGLGDSPTTGSRQAPNN
jgi:hypothetical protein